MFKGASLKFKLIISFLVMAFIVLAVGLLGFRSLQKLRESSAVMEEVDELKADLIQREAEHLMWSQSVLLSLINEESNTGVQTDYTLCNFGKWYYGEGYDYTIELAPSVKEYMDQLEDPHENLHSSVIQLEEYMSADEFETATDYYINESMIYLTKVQDLLEKIIERLEERNLEILEEQAQDRRINNIITIVAIVAGVVLALVLGLAISINLSKRIGDSVMNLDNGSDQLNNASQQISSSSQELSSGASQLASSVEEMTSSLEELQSIIETNSKSVNEAEVMMKQSNSTSQKTSENMEDMKVAMKDINENSNQINKIIKVIDDIAFQTNILALNAAVEAARAGEAGAGFAVVADQVKNLAQKSADAAKETATLIEKAIISVNNGEKRANEVAEMQEKSTDLSEKVNVLLNEINRASQEQLKGANQITKAISEINNVVQQTASTSEETAAAGEELLSQSESVKYIVADLNEVVVGKGNSDKGKEKKSKEEHERYIAQQKQKMVEHKQQPENRPSKKSDSDDVEIIKPEDKIPMKDFDEF